MFCDTLRAHICYWIFLTKDFFLLFLLLLFLFRFSRTSARSSSNCRESTKSKNLELNRSGTSKNEKFVEQFFFLRCIDCCTRYTRTISLVSHIHFLITFLFYCILLSYEFFPMNHRHKLNFLNNYQVTSSMKLMDDK